MSLFEKINLHEVLARSLYNVKKPKKFEPRAWYVVSFLVEHQEASYE